MDTETAILIVLGLFILVLLYLRNREFFSGRELQYKSPNPIGSAATIGNREVQQDLSGSALGDDSTLLVIADGRGHGQEGKIAAKIAVDTCLDLYAEYQNMDKPQYYFRRAFNLANHKILETVDESNGSASAAVAIIKGNYLYYALVGNIKVAVFRGGDLIPVSEGQTIDILARHRYEEGRISKETALSLLNRERLYNVLGQDTFSDIEFFSKPLALRQGDLVVMMTDGVTYALKWSQIENCLKKDGSSQDMAKGIIEAVDSSAKEDKDNAAVLIYQN